MRTPPPADEPGVCGTLSVPVAPEVTDEAMDLDLADARGGRHRLIGRGWLAYSLWLLTPLALALAVATVSALPSGQGTPYAGDAPDPLPSNFPIPTPAPQPTATPSPGSTTGTPGTGGPPTSAGSTAASLDAGLEPAAAVSVTIPISIEAESGQLGSLLKVASTPGASGGSLVSGLGRTPSRSLTIVGVTAPFAGEYYLELWYAADTATGLRIRTGAGTNVTVSCPATESGIVAEYSTTVLLAAGSNTITVGATSNGHTALDRITLW